MISLIAAISDNNCIGKNGEIPWHLPEDLRRVRDYTLGKVIIMGRNTWESLPENRRPLPGRTNVVITRENKNNFPNNVEVYNSVEEAIDAHKNEDIVGFGGERIYSAILPYATELSITHVHQTIENGTAFFPTFDKDVWEIVSLEAHDGYDVCIYAKKV